MVASRTKSDFLSLVLLHLGLMVRVTLRRIKAFGLSPYPTLLISIFLFFVSGNALFSRFTWAGYLMVSLPAFMMLRLSSVPRDEFLLSLLGSRGKIGLRFIENLFLSFPFLVLLLFQHEFLLSISLPLLSIVFSFSPVPGFKQLVIPAPFPRHAFEFRTGFRKTFFFFPLFLMLTLASVVSENINLGMLSMGLMTFVLIGYFQKPEDEYFVWIYADAPASFIGKKIRLALLCSLLILLPPSVLLLLYFPLQIHALLSFYTLALVFLCTIILIKYSAFPLEAGLPEMLVLGLCLYFPPALLGVIPFFFFKAVRKLNPFLHD